MADPETQRIAPQADHAPQHSADVNKPRRLQSSEVAEIHRAGFTLLGESYQRHSDCHFIFLEHSATGAKAVLVQNNDTHLRSEIRFITLPADSSGVFHKLEHGVISEASLFPVADVWDEMTRSLILTDANAATAQYYTCYHASGTDQYSLTEITRVTAQSILSGRPTERTYLREHGHLQPDPESPCGFSFSGVVYNEMAGRFSDPATWEFLALKAALFPGSPLSHHSGGDPSVMKSMTLAEFQRAYDENYSASKAHFGLYGSVSISENLALLHSILEGHGRGDPPPAIPAPVIFSEPRSVEIKVPLAAGASLSPENDLKFSIHWKLPDRIDDQELFELDILVSLLRNGQRDPFMQRYQEAKVKALYDSAKLDSWDFERSVQLSFVRATREDIEACRATTEQILQEFAKDGFNAKDIDSVIGGAERWEKTKNRSLRIGNTYINKVRLNEGMNSLLKGRFSVDERSCAERAIVLREKLAANKPVFQNLIKQYLLSNKNKVELTLVPDPNLYPEWLLAQEKALKAEVAMLSTDERRQIQEIASVVAVRERALQEGQEISKVPKAHIDERYRIVESPERHLSDLAGATILRHSGDLSGQIKVRLQFNLSGVPKEDIPLAGFIIPLLLEIGVDGRRRGDFPSTASYLGGSIDGNISSVNLMDADMGAAATALTTFNCFFRSQAESAPIFLRDIVAAVQQPELKDYEFMRYIVERSREKSRRELGDSRDLTSQLRYHVKAGLDPAGEICGFFLPERRLKSAERLAGMLADNPAKTSAALLQICSEVFRRGNLSVHVVASDDHWALLEPVLREQVSVLPGGKSKPVTGPFVPVFDAVGIVSPAEKSFLCMGVKLRDEVGVPLQNSASAALACFIMSRHLTAEVRRIGGSYGAGASYDYAGGHIAFSASQVSKINDTLARFRIAVDYLRNDATKDLLDRAKIQLLSSFVAPRTDEEKADLDRQHFFTNESHEMKQRFLTEAFDATLADVKNIANYLDRGFASETVVRVIGSKETLETVKWQGHTIEMRPRV